MNENEMNNQTTGENTGAENSTEAINDYLVKFSKPYTFENETYRDRSFRFRKYIYKTVNRSR